MNIFWVCFEIAHKQSKGEILDWEVVEAATQLYKIKLEPMNSNHSR